MAKTAIVAKRGNVFLVEPERLVLVYDKADPLYDPRVEDAPDERMIANVAMHGVLEPVLARKNGEAIEVIAGRGRVKAALEANKRLAAEGKPAINVPVMLKGGSDADLFGIMVAENEIRRGDTVLAKGEKARRLVNFGYTVQQVAVTFGVSRQAVEGWLAADALPQPIRDAVEAGEVSATAAIQMAGLPREEQVARFEAASQQGAKPTKQAMRGAAARQGAGKPAPGKTGTPGSPTRMPKHEYQIRDKLASLSVRTDYDRGVNAALRWVLGRIGDDEV